MGLLKGPLKKRESTGKYVYSEDPDVKPPPNRKGCGWFPIGEAHSTGPGATIITIQGLGADQRMSCRDVRGENVRYLAAARAGLIDCNEVTRDPNKNAAEGLSTWLDCLAIDDPTAVGLLGLRVLNLSDGMDPETYYTVSRATFGVVPGEGSDGGTKSPDGAA